MCVQDLREWLAQRVFLEGWVVRDLPAVQETRALEDRWVYQDLKALQDPPVLQVRRIVFLGFCAGLVGNVPISNSFFIFDYILIFFKFDFLRFVYILRW